MKLYGAWVSPKGHIINVSEIEGHFNYAIAYLYPSIKDHNKLTDEERNTFYIKMYQAGFLRLMYTRKGGYTIERGQNQVVRMSQLSYVDNAESVDVYYHANTSVSMR